MVSWVPEVLIPSLLLVAAFPELPRRWVLLMAPTTYLSDLDYILPPQWADAMGMPHLHRVVTHTLVWRALLVLGLWLAWRRGPRKAGAGFWAYATTPGWPLAILLLAYYLTAHALMDIFTGGVVLFWPFSNMDFLVDVQVVINLTTGQVEPTVETQVQQGPNQLDQRYEWLSNEHAAILALVLLVVGAAVGRLLWRRRTRAGEGSAPAAAESRGGRSAAAGKPRAPSKQRLRQPSKKGK